VILDTPLGKFRWIDNWISIPDTPSGKISGRTHGIVVLRDGSVVIFHQADPALLIYSAEGKLLNSWGNYTGAHGLTLVQENNEELLWLVDLTTKEAVKTTLSGSVRMKLQIPPHPSYVEGKYIPTWLAVAEERFGGNGDLWLADGYGSYLVHRYDRTGNYLGSLDGTEGAGRFNCPHALAIDTRRGVPEFYVADRGNGRFQVYAMDGSYRRSFGGGFLSTPDISVQMGPNLLVPELIAGLTVLDADDRPMASLGFNTGVNAKEGWPNDRRWVSEGLFNSPHSAAVDSQGNIYVVEWISGGRVIKLERIPS